MKIRNGFVSNSSSSSFIILSKTKLTKKMLKEKFAVSENHPLGELIDKIANALINNGKEFKSWEEYVKNDYDGYEDEALDFSPVSKEDFDNWKVFLGDLSTDGEPIESFLCNTDINFKSEDFIIIHNGGF